MLLKFLQDPSTDDFHVRNAATGLDIARIEQSTGGRVVLAQGYARGRTAVADANYTVVATDSRVVYTSITAARTVTLPAAATGNAGSIVEVKDESGSVTGAHTITVVVASSGTIDGASGGKVISTAYGSATFYSNGTAWFSTGFGSGTGPVFRSRTTVADTNYTVVATDFLIAYTALTAARTVTLPAAAAANAGQHIEVKDEAGTAGTDNITIAPATGTIDGVSSKAISANYGAFRAYSTGAVWFSE